METKVIRIFKIILITALFTTANTTYAKNKEFPERDLYPTTSYIALADLYKIKNEAIIVNVRSAYEHKILHIKGAINISMSSSDVATLTRISLRYIQATWKISC